MPKMKTAISAQINRQIAYLIKREQEYQKYLIKTDRDYEKDLIRLYNKTMDNIANDIARQYASYAKKEGMSLDVAYAKITKFDADSFRDKAREYVKNRDFSDEANEQLRAYNLKIRTSRLQLMKNEILLETVDLANQENKMLEQRLNEVFLEELNRQSTILGLNKATREAVIKKMGNIVNGDFHGATFSDRIWANQAQLHSTLANGLQKTIVQGRGYEEWTKFLKASMSDNGKENALFNAFRLAKTETSRVFSSAALESYRQGGFGQYIWIAEIDDRTCETCQALDGVIFDITSNTTGGLDMPPVHPLCRCTTAAYEDREEIEIAFDKLDEALDNEWD